MRYLLIDHITEYKAGEFITGTKNVAMSEDFLEFHFPGNPIMPGVLLIEAMTQLAGWLQAASTDFKKWFLISRIIKSRFYNFALPGDTVEIRVKALAQSEDTHAAGDPSLDGPEIIAYQGTGTVNGKKIILTEFEGNIVELNDIDDVYEQKRFFEILTRNRKL